MKFVELCKLDDRLLALWNETQVLAGKMARIEGAQPKPPAPDFCRYVTWYAMPQSRGLVGLRFLLQQIANTNPVIAEHWDLCYHTLLDELPACRGHESCAADFPLPEVSPKVLAGEMEALKRNNGRVGFGSIIDRLKHKVAEMEAEEKGTPPPVPPKMVDTNVPDDKAEPVFIVRSVEDARALALDLRIKERFEKGEITKWYARNCIYVCDPDSRKVLLSAKLDKNNVTGPLGWKPVVLTFADPELERKLAQVCVQVVTVLGTRKPGDDYDTFDIEKIREAVKEIKHVVASLDNEDMPLGVLDGWLGEVCRTRMLQDFPVAYAWPALLSAASVMVPAKLLPSGGGAAWDVRANVFVGVIGPVGSGKSSVFNLAFFLLGLKDPLLKRLKAGSGEGMAEDIGDVAGEPRLVFVDELEHLLKKINYKGATFANTLDDAYTTDWQQFRVANRKQITLNVRLSMAGGVPEQGFAETFGAGTVGGLHSRFLFGVCPSNFEGYAWRPPEGGPALTVPSEDDPDFLTAEVRPQAITIDRSVWDETRRWQRELKIHGRCVELGLKAAVISAAFDNRGTLKASDLGPALAFAKYQDRVHKRFLPNPGKNDEAIVAENVLRYLHEHGAGGEWLNRREMLKSINAYHHGPGTVNRALAALQQNNEIELNKSGRQLLVRLVLDRG